MSSLAEIDEYNPHHSHKWSKDDEAEYDGCLGHIWETNCGDEAIQEMLIFLKRSGKWKNCNRCLEKISHFEKMMEPPGHWDDCFHAREQDFL